MKRNKKLAVILSIVIIVSAVFVNGSYSVAAQMPLEEYDEIPTAFTDDLMVGVQVISSVEDFDIVRNNLSGNYILANDIDLSEVSGIWKPIGKADAPFTGTFDGNGHKIFNLEKFEYLEGPVGIFGYVSNCTIKNIGVEMKENASMEISEYNGTICGLLVGNGNGTIVRSYAKGNLCGKMQGSAFSGYYGVHIAGLLCGKFSGNISECYTEGEVHAEKSDLTFAYAYAGGIVGHFQGNMQDSYSISEVYSAASSGAGTSSYAGGCIGYASTEVFLSNSYHIGYVNERRDGVDKVLEGLIGYADGICQVGNCYYQELGVEHVNDYGNSLSTEAMQLQNNYTGWDFDSIWALETTKNENCPYLRNIGITNDDIQPIGETVKVVYDECFPKSGSVEMPIDGSVSLVFDRSIQLSENISEKIYFLDEDGKQWDVYVTLGTDQKTLIITSKEKFAPMKKYILVIGENVIVDKEDSSILFTGLAGYSFTTNYLTTSPQLGYREVVKMKYEKNLVGKEDKSVLPFPDDNLDDYVSEFRMLAMAMGYEEQVQEMSNEDIKRLLNSEFAMPIVSNTNQMYMTSETNKTIMDVMRDIFMLQEMQRYIIEEEQKLVADPTIEKMEDSVKTMITYYMRYQEYLSETNANTSYNPIVVTHGLLTIAEIYCATYLPDGSGEFLPNLFALEEVVLKTSESGQGILDKLSSSNSYNSQQYLEVTDELKKMQSTADNLLAGEVTVGQLVKDYGIEYFKIDGFEILRKVFDVQEDSAGDVIVIHIEALHKAYKQLKKLDTFLDMPYCGFLAGSKIVAKYMSTMESMYTFIKDQYPAWLFYTQYYMLLCNPSAYNHIYGGKNTVELTIGQGMFTVEQYETEENALLKQLMSPLCKGNSNLEGTNSIYIVQYGTINNENVYKLVSMANLFSEIRCMDFKEYQKYLVQYAMEKYMSEQQKTTKVVVACPTTVNVIEESTGRVVFTLSNNQDFETNFKEFGVFYLFGDERDIKEIVLAEGYNIQIEPTAEGTMDCEVLHCVGNAVVSEELYTDISLDLNEKYYIDCSETENPVIRVAGDEETVIYPNEDSDNDASDSDTENKLEEDTEKNSEEETMPDNAGGQTEENMPNNVDKHIKENTTETVPDNENTINKEDTTDVEQDMTVSSKEDGEEKELPVIDDGKEYVGETIMEQETENSHIIRYLCIGVVVFGVLVLAFVCFKRWKRKEL